MTKKARNRAALILFCALLPAALLPGRSYSESVFRFPLFYLPKSLHSSMDNSVFTNLVVNQVYDGLVAFDDNLRVIPGLAESWTVSRDGLLYTFRIRRGVLFHDGRALTSRDVAASLVRVFHPDNTYIPEMLVDRIDGALAYREGKSDTVTGIQATADDAVTVRLTEPYAPFLSVLAMPITRVVPADATREMLDRRPVGSGPFRFLSWSGEDIVLTANQNYFRGRPRLDQVRFVVYPKAGSDAAFQDYLDGKLEGCDLPGSAGVDELRADGHQVLIRPRLALLFYGFNVNTPPFTDRRVRLAMALGFNQQRHVEEELGGNYIPAYQVVPPGMPGYTPDNALLGYDPARAARLLAEAGHPGGEGLPEITIASASASDFARKELSLFAADMAGLGIRVKPVFVDGWETFTGGLSAGQYPLYRYALFADIPDPDDFLAALFTGGSPTNFSGFSDDEVDRILGAAKGETDPVRRITLYRQAERIILEQAPAIPLLYLTTQVTFQPYVKGIDLPATGTTNLPLHRVFLER